MASDPELTDLLSNRHACLVLRLNLDRNGQIQRGIVIDANENPVGQFRHVDELPALLSRWLSRWGSAEVD
ncbi:MAG: hypothetical protein HC802_02630 [Caldilineaceae bacterium]|nr:hypothetical protein [Caldilineaceae bacterium]